jgi:hypothetical protein
VIEVTITEELSCTFVSEKRGSVTRSDDEIISLISHTVGENESAIRF